MKQTKNNKYGLGRFHRALVKRQLSVVGIAVVVLLLLWLFVNEVLTAAAEKVLVHSVDYTLLAIIRYKTEFLFLVIAFLAILVIWLVSQARLIKTMSRLIEVVETIHSQDGIIELPAGLAEVETVLNEIREQNRVSRQQAKEAEQRKNDLVTYLAHDLKTPLTSVIGYLSLLNDEPDISQPSARKFAQIALRKAYRIEDLTNELFDITCYNLHEMPLSPVPCNLTVMLMQIWEEFIPLADEGGLQIRTELQEDITVECDSDKIARVFENLMKNACAYSDRNSMILLKAAQEEHFTVISVQNHGAPIPGYKLKTVFEQFTRLDSARSHRTGGAGLGLAIAKEIVQLHNGEITAESSGGLTTFTVKLPNQFGGAK